jgi:hypothetical protein
MVMKLVTYFINEIYNCLPFYFRCPEDIDLFTGHLSERRAAGSILGPTGQCILAKQFKRLRDGDRFFFERRDSHQPWIGFTTGRYSVSNTQYTYLK